MIKRLKCLCLFNSLVSGVLRSLLGRDEDIAIDYAGVNTLIIFDKLF